jgi:peptidoglycan/xylan/chitin deacetylase (PgdA/CDA1 family)
MDVHRGNGTLVTVILTAATLFVMLLLSACNKRSSKTFHSLLKDTLVVKQVVSLKQPEKKKKKKKLYITFDDGPNKGTKNVLDIVQDEQVPVSFFIVGEHVFASTLQRQVWDSLREARDIDISSHSYSHADNRYDHFYQNPAEVVADFKRTRDSLKLSNNIIRTPGRNIWRLDSLSYTDIKKSAPAADSLASAGFLILGWDVEWQYNHKSMAVTSTAEQLIDEIDSSFSKKRTKREDHLVLLAHDQVYATTDDSLQLRKFLQKLKAKDEYEFSLITAYPRSGR